MFNAAKTQQQTNEHLYSTHMFVTKQLQTLNRTHTFVTTQLQNNKHLCGPHMFATTQIQTTDITAPTYFQQYNNKHLHGTYILHTIYKRETFIARIYTRHTRL